MSLSSITIIGNTSGPPRQEVSQSGTNYSIVNVAVNRKDYKTGQSKPVWYSVTLWGTQSDFWSDKVNQGDKVCAVGDFYNEPYLNKDGNPAVSNRISAKNFLKLNYSEAPQAAQPQVAQPQVAQPQPTQHVPQAPAAPAQPQPVPPVQQAVPPAAPVPANPAASDGTEIPW